MDISFSDLELDPEMKQATKTDGSQRSFSIEIDGASDTENDAS